MSLRFPSCISVNAFCLFCSPHRLCTCISLTKLYLKNDPFHSEILTYNLQYYRNVVPSVRPITSGVIDIIIHWSYMSKASYQFFNILCAQSVIKERRVEVLFWAEAEFTLCNIEYWMWGQKKRCSNKWLIAHKSSNFA